MARAVPPVETISTPKSLRPRAKSAIPVLSVTLINARLIAAITYNGKRVPPSDVDPRRRHRSRSCRGYGSRGQCDGRQHRLAARRFEREHHLQVRPGAAAARNRIARTHTCGAEGTGYDADRRRFSKRECGVAQTVRSVRECPTRALAAGLEDALH